MPQLLVPTLLKISGSVANPRGTLGVRKFSFQRSLASCNWQEMLLVYMSDNGPDRNEHKPLCSVSADPPHNFKHV